MNKVKNEIKRDKRFFMKFWKRNVWGSFGIMGERSFFFGGF